MRLAPWCSMLILHVWNWLLKPQVLRLRTLQCRAGRVLRDSPVFVRAVQAVSQRGLAAR